MTKAERDFFEAAREFAKWELAESERDENTPLDFGGGLAVSEKIREAYRALLAEEEKRKGGDAPNVPAECGSSREPAGIPVARGASTGPAVAEPKRGVEECLAEIDALLASGFMGRVVDGKDTSVADLMREALRLYREERERENAGVDEFNAGFESAKANGSVKDEPDDFPQDEWRSAFERLKLRAQTGRKAVPEIVRLYLKQEAEKMGVIL